ncbi:MAG: hypothetical protein R3D00_28875 [Bacteroidia bacterium]
MKSLSAFIILIVITFSSVSAQRWINDSLLWVKGPMKTFTIKHFQTIQSANGELISRELTAPLPKNIFNDTLFFFKNVFSKLQVQDVRLAKSTPEGEMVFVHVSAAMGRRLPYDYFRTSPKLRTWAKQKGFDYSRYIAFKVQEKGSQYKIVSR